MVWNGDVQSALQLVTRCCLCLVYDVSSYLGQLQSKFFSEINVFPITLPFFVVCYMNRETFMDK